MERFTSYYSSPVGLLKLQCTGTALISLLFISGEAEASDQHAILDLCRNQLDEFFSGKRKQFDLPLQQEGSEFQQKVWELLMAIPFGKRLSYQELSRRYGDLKAIR